MNAPMLYQAPVWVTLIVFVAIEVASIELGYRMALRRRGKKGEDRGKDGSDVVLTSMLALLALVLAFTYSFALSRRDLRKTAMIDEANAISTAFLKADMAREPGRTALREALASYADTRVVSRKTAGSPEKIKAFFATTLAAQAKIWPAVREVLAVDNVGPGEASIVQSVTEVLDMHTTRVARAFDTLPSSLLWLLVALAGLSLGIATYNITRSSGHIGRWHLWALAVGLAVVMTAITDFDRSLSGTIVMGNEPIIDTAKALHVDLEREHERETAAGARP